MTRVDDDHKDDDRAVDEMTEKRRCTRRCEEEIDQRIVELGEETDHGCVRLVTANWLRP